MNSKMFLLSAKDFIKGAALAVITAIVTFLYELPGGIETVDWDVLIQISITAFVGYIVKNYFSDASGRIGGKVG